MNLMKVDATYENGVFVPAQPPALAEHEQVRLTVEPASPVSGNRQVVRNRADRRIHIDPLLAREIATSAEFHPDDI